MSKSVVEDLKNTLENVIDLFDGDYQKSVSVNLSLIEFEKLLELCELWLEL